MNYCGIDLHSNNCVVIVSNDEDRIMYQKRLPNELAQIATALEPYRHELAGVVIESTYNWYWLVDGLTDAGYRVHLAHPAAIKKCLFNRHLHQCARQSVLRRQRTRRHLPVPRHLTHQSSSTRATTPAKRFTWRGAGRMSAAENSTGAPSSMDNGSSPRSNATSTRSPIGVLNSSCHENVTA